jgi:hypothetical protein
VEEERFSQESGEAYSQITCKIIYNGVASNTDIKILGKFFQKR